MLHLAAFALLSQLAAVALVWLAAEVAVLWRTREIVSARDGTGTVDLLWRAWHEAESQRWARATWAGAEHARWN